jgi:hypothetical protein
MEHDNTKAEPFLGSLFKEILSTCPVCCSNIDSLTSGQEIGSLKVFTARVTNWLHATDVDNLVSCWDTCLNRGGCCAEK